MIESSYHNVSHRRRQGSQWQSHTQDLVSSDTFRRHTHRSYLYTARLGMDTSINLYLMQLNNKVYIMACVCFPHQFSLKLKGTNMHCYCWNVQDKVMWVFQKDAGQDKNRPLPHWKQIFLICFWLSLWQQTGRVWFCRGRFAACNPHLPIPHLHASF